MPQQGHLSLGMLLSGVSPHNCPPHIWDLLFLPVPVMDHVTLLEENTICVLSPTYHIEHYMPLISEHLTLSILQKSTNPLPETILLKLVHEAIATEILTLYRIFK